MTMHVGEVRMFAGNYAPQGWRFCDGEILQIAESETLFSLIGTTYGGDGESTFALPDLRGRVPIHHGASSEGTPFPLGDRPGAETITLTTNEMPPHTHTLVGSADVASLNTPEGNVLAQAQSTQAGARFYRAPSGATPVAMNPVGIAPAGGGQPHDNMQPYLAINFIISLFGELPSES